MRRPGKNVRRFVRVGMRRGAGTYSEVYKEIGQCLPRVNSRNSDVRYGALLKIVEMCGQLKEVYGRGIPERAERVLINSLLTERDSFIHKNIIDYMEAEKIKSPKIITRLMAALGNENPKVHRNAANALRGFGFMQAEVDKGNYLASLARINVGAAGLLNSELGKNSAGIKNLRSLEKNWPYHMYKRYLREWRMQKIAGNKRSLSSTERLAEKNAFEGLNRISRAYPNLGGNLATSWIRQIKRT